MRFLLVFTILFFTSAAYATCTIDDVSSDGITGFQEAVISVADLDAANETWQTVGGYEVICDGPVEPGLAAFWGLPADTPMHNVVLRKGLGDRGFIRLVKIYGLPQKQIRSSGMPWDTGGYFDLYVYVSDVDTVFEQLRARGWQGYTDPVNYTLQVFDITEAIARGPNGEALVLMQRNAPPYDKVSMASESGMSWPFNTALLVSDYDANEYFFSTVLGWKVHLNGESLTPPPGLNPTAIPLNLASTLPRRFAAYANSAGDRNGSLQILKTEGMTGVDFSGRAEPPNLGILTMRVPVDDLDALAARVKVKRYPIHVPTMQLTMPPYGPVKMMALKAPNGARIEFFEQQ
jgi:catechol 2,3-dioxygenase-like lactoylglutathione lyase family enzyme